MNLIIDFGNTQIKVGIFDEKILKTFNYISYDDINQLIEVVNNFQIDKIGITNVREIPKEFEKYLGKKEIFIFSLNVNRSSLPIQIDYKTPLTLGNDRICNAVAANSIFPNNNVLIIDMGTCNKFDFITKDKRYLGGSISPGYKMRLDAMHQFTDQLPLLDPVIGKDIIGDSTANSMISGAYYGIIGEINFFIEQYKSHFNDLEVVLTGGFSTYFEKVLKNDIFADPYLTLRGLNEILNFQEEK